jgi:hypothetical protein
MRFVKLYYCSNISREKGGARTLNQIFKESRFKQLTNCVSGSRSEDATPVVANRLMRTEHKLHASVNTRNVYAKRFFI